ncbi:Biotin/lipoyl attachment:Carbamoyl-phosphate synthase L chain, ATP-binding:Carbamoyl-phosphate synthetase large chain [Shewanella piezotolerans WP3]|uniref:Biotin carboxylase n=1 Tax=Shewanella piezotolerans (strain WP3 / JCM 13877) TaxID=225849 RepID=B8CRY6_SHEPW|nr:acetyl/propionyl/methylcrotonyl-CoA carboxylase subunit alpha [Shewanella piezotolerans]ACJ30144.1 Biotin/lipoyl attachment:Carbamoyl-phosphate synthase L chain, ATP-binding:Carbamoyl-phosphate synthetase large chain [Shewanella piezotolerans WP3]
MFTKLLIANRGEIACRIIKTAQAMGVRTVALYSDADIDARHVAMADESFYLGGSAPADSYLKGELIIEIAKKSGAQAIHPGYGFLSENAEFALKCEQSGIAFVGPSAAAIDSMGSKSAAKEIMGAANVPLVPGYHGDAQDDDVLVSEANEMGFPLLIKAAYGGGGKGMRIVESKDEVLEAIQSARREAISSFGNDKLLMERYLRQPRHVEVQVFADSFGNCIYLSDRDCSIQRRHQKVVEEAPAPGLSDALRVNMGEAAVAAAKAINYEGAGTVEFLLDTDGSFYFMEMNTRLQVEHPVTELVTGQDLVKWQLMVASGSKLPLAQDEVRIHGHAFEVRIYAEDPQNDFLPASGKLNFLREPEQSKYVRIDSGIRENDVISNFYDPMISKLITWDESRPRALQRLVHALASYQISGLKHNIEFLANIAEHAAFANADFSTDFIERYGEALIGHGLSDNQSNERQTALALAALYQLCARKADAKRCAVNSHDPYSPWGAVNGFRLNSASVHQVALLDDDQQVNHLELTESEVASQSFYQLAINDTLMTLSGELIGETLHAEIAVNSQSIKSNAHKIKVPVSQVGDDFTLFINSSSYHYQAIQAEVVEEQDNLEDKLKAPMNGTIVTHLVAVGDEVAAGQGIMVMEAMKMEYTIEAPYAGVVSAFFFDAGELVSDGMLLAEVSASEEE